MREASIRNGTSPGAGCPAGGRTSSRLMVGRRKAVSWGRCLLLVAGVTVVACSEHEVGTVSLIDEISDTEARGPWRVILTVHNRHIFLKDSHGLDRARDTVVQTEPISTSRLAALAQPGETVLLRLMYAEAWGTGGFVECRLLHEGNVVADARVELGARTVEFELPVPASGSDVLEIVHTVRRGTYVPFAGAVALALLPHADESAGRKARHLLRWAARSSPSDRVGGLIYRRFPLALNGSTRDCALLTASDKLTLDVAECVGKHRLQFWHVASHGPPDTREVLMLERLAHDGWRRVSSWTASELADGTWGRSMLDMDIGREWRSLRFALSADSEVLAIGEPVLLPPSGSVSRRLNLILIDLDTMRADRLGCYGYTERPTSAQLDSLLEDWGFSIFRRAYSTAPWTLPATAKFLTSRYLDIHEGNTIPRRYTTLAEILRSNGYYCAAFTGGGPLRNLGFEQGFHDFHWSGKLGKVEDTFPQAMSWLAEESIRPFFLFVHTFEPHTPYTRDTFCRGMPNGRLGDISRGEGLMPPGFHSCTRLSSEESLYVEAAYDGGVRRACEATAELLSLVDRLGLRDETAVVVLSDHGEEFWEHFEVFALHAHSLYGELVNVPFMVFSPELDGASTPIRSEVSTADLVPTLADLLGIGLQEACDGVSLCPLISGGTVEREVPILATRAPSYGAGWLTSPTRIGVIAGTTKYIAVVDSAGEGRDPAGFVSGMGCTSYPQKEELFLLDQDPRERRNVVEQRSSLARKMAALLRRGIEDALQPCGAPTPDAQVPQVPEDLTEQLRALGYVDPRAVSETAGRPAADRGGVRD